MTNPRRSVVREQQVGSQTHEQPQPTTVGRARIPMSLRRQWLSIGRAVLLLVIACVLALVLAMILVIVQGGYTDARQVGAILVLNSDCADATRTSGGLCPQEQMLDYALDLYRRGYAPHVLLLSNSADAPAVRAYLQAHSFPDQALLLEDQGTTQWQHVRRASELARNNGINSALLVGTQPHMLLGLKMTHDLGLATFAAPLPMQDSGIIAMLRAVLLEAVAYWRYVLLGQ